MKNAHPLTSLMVERSLDVKKNIFHPREESEELLGHEVSYLSTIDALIYLTTCIHSGITFSVNLLASPNLKAME